MGAAIRDGIVAFTGVVGAIRRDASNLLALRNLAEKVGQDRCLSDVASGDLDSPALQRFLVDPEVDPAPDAPFGATVLAYMPLAFAFTLALDARAVDRKVQRALGASIRDVHGQRLLAARQRAEVGHDPVETDRPQQAFDEPGRLPERHAERHLHRQAGPNGCIAVGLMAATPACRHAIPPHLGIEPDRERAPAFERFVIG